MGDQGGDIGRLRFLGRDFVGFRNAVARQAAAFQTGASRAGASPVGVEARWLELEALEHAVLVEGAGRSGAADVLLVVTDWLPELIASGQLLALDNLLAARPPIGWPDAWTPSLRGLQTGPDGRTYGLAYHDGPVLLLYRRDLFEDPGERERFRARFGHELAPATTWDAYLDVARHFTRPDEGLWGTVLAGHPDGHNNVYDFLTHLWSRGGTLLDDGGRARFASSEGREALRFLHGLRHEHGVVDPAASGWDSVASGQRFADGHAATMVNWAGFAALSALPGSPTAGRVGCAPVPSGAGPGGRSVSLNVYWVLAVAAGAADPELAYAFLRHCASPAMDRATSEEGATGTRRSTWDDPGIRAMAPYYAVLEEVHATAVSLPALPAYPAINQVLNRMVDDVMEDRAGVDDALERAAAGVDRLAGR